MAVATMITRPEEAVDLLSGLLSDNAGLLGLEYVGTNDESLIPRYPAVVVSAGPVAKELHATHTFNVEIRVFMWVYHADLTLTHKQRTREDLLLATGIIAAVEDDKTFSDRVVFSYVEAEVPGIIQPRSTKGSAVVGTRLNWYALSQQRW